MGRSVTGCTTKATQSPVPKKKEKKKIKEGGGGVGGGGGKGKKEEEAYSLFLDVLHYNDIGSSKYVVDVDCLCVCLKECLLWLDGDECRRVMTLSFVVVLLECIAQHLGR